MTSHPLANRRILVVEDEYYLAMDLERELAMAGMHVVGPVPSVEQAFMAIAAEPDLEGAILDINLNGDMSFPVADTLIERKIPFVFTTGYVDGDLGKRYPNIHRCEKPTDAKKLLSALTAAFAG